MLNILWFCFFVDTVFLQESLLSFSGIEVYVIIFCIIDGYNVCQKMTWLSTHLYVC